MLTRPSFKKSLIVELFQGNYLNGRWTASGGKRRLSLTSIFSKGFWPIEMKFFYYNLLIKSFRLISIFTLNPKVPWRYWRLKSGFGGQCETKKIYKKIFFFFRNACNVCVSYRRLISRAQFFWKASNQLFKVQKQNFFRVRHEDVDIGQCPANMLIQVVF